MDNAAGREQVEPLVPPEGCVLLVTSRQHFVLPGLFALDLETLPPTDARQLLLRIAPRIGERADEIAKLCGYLPLALRLAASALAERANLSPADYVRRLSDAKTRLSLVEASLTLRRTAQPRTSKTLALARRLPRHNRRCGGHGRLGTDADAAQDALGELLRYSLLDWDADTKRYRLHDLARLFADSRMSDDERHSTQMRHAAHYLTVLRECDDLYLKGGDAIKSGLALFDVERRNIEAGQEWICRHSSGDEAAAQLCNKYPEAGVYVLNLRQHPRESISWLEAALMAALNRGRCLGRATHEHLGVAYAALGETRRAVEFFEQALVVAREVGDRRGEGAVLGNSGNAYAALGETRRAIEFYEQYSHPPRDRRPARRRQRFGQSGNAYADLGEMRRAIEFYEQALVSHMR